MHLVLMGAPGSGKGTYAKMLKDIFAVPHISTGEMFRKAIQDGTELGKLAQSLIDKGNFVPDEITIEMLKNRIKDFKERDKGRIKNVRVHIEFIIK